MADYYNPDAPVSGNGWLSRTYNNNNPSNVAFHQVGYTQSPFYTGNEPSRRTMTNNPGYTFGQFAQQAGQFNAPTTQLKPFSTYPAAPSVPTLNQFAAQQQTPWAQNGATPQPFNVTPPASNPVTPNVFGYNYESPQLIPFDISNALNSWNRKAGSWNYQPNSNTQMPIIDWNQYNNQHNGANGYHIPPSQCGIQPQYPSGYQTTPLNQNWDGICETNFKQQF